MDVKKIRKDFPILNQKLKGKPVIYMDSACMSLKPVQVIEAIDDYYRNFPGCAGRSLHKLSKAVEESMHKTRNTAKKFFNAQKDEEIIFTKNTTEGINLVVNSLGIEKGQVLCSDKEHNSNLLPLQKLAKDSKGSITHDVFKFNDIEDLKKKLSKKTKLVSFVHTSNLDGSTQDAKELIKTAHDHGALVMVDAAQSAPHREIDVRKLGVDFMSCSGHKMLGPTATGMLYGRYDLLEKMNPAYVGGETVFDSTYTSAQYEKPPMKFEYGLQHYAGINGLREALNYLKRIGLNNIYSNEQKLNKIITEGLKGTEGINILGPQDPSQRSGIISFTADDIDVHEIALLLDQTSNVMIRSGAHCCHSWFNAHDLKGSARASLYLYNTEDEAKQFLEALDKVLSVLRR